MQRGKARSEDKYGAWLTFQAQEGETQAEFADTDLIAEDRTMLAKLVARYRPDDGEAQAAVGIYSELIGDTKTADGYYENARSEIQQRLDKIFISE